MEAMQQVRELTEDFTTKLQTATKTLEDREAQLVKGWQQLEEEKRKMAAFVERSATDLVHINVGGEVMTAQRGTLMLAEGTLLEAIFSGRWEQSLKRDEGGRVFLDFSPTPFKALLSFLRASRDAGPGKRVAPPVPLPEYKEEYEAMVGYLGLAELLGCASSSPMDLSCPAGALICAQSTGGTRDGSIQCDGAVLRAGTPVGRPRCAVGGATLLGEDGSRGKTAWKVTVRALAASAWFCAGIIGDASPVDRSPLDPTCWAWASGSVNLSGTPIPGHAGWNGWAQGDVAVFQLDMSSGLRMFHRRSGRVYHVMQGVSADVTKRARVHFCFSGAGTEVEVSQVTAEELTEAGF